MIYGYTRVSTAEQASADRTSLADQERTIQGVALVLSLAEAPTMFSDPGISGALPLGERPGGRALLAALQAGDTLIAAKMDRVFRSATDALVTADLFQQRKVALILPEFGMSPVTGNGAGRLFFTIMAGCAEFEKGRILERMQDGRKGKKARGGHIGGFAPYGWRVIGSGRDAKLEQVEDEQRTIHLAQELRAAGASLRDVSAQLAGTYGRKNRLGKPFAAEQVKRILEAE